MKRFEVQVPSTLSCRPDGYITLHRTDSLFKLFRYYFFLRKYIYKHETVKVLIHR